MKRTFALVSVSLFLLGAGVARAGSPPSLAVGAGQGTYFKFHFAAIGSPTTGFPLAAHGKADLLNLELNYRLSGDVTCLYSESFFDGTVVATIGVRLTYSIVVPDVGVVYAIALNVGYSTNFLWGTTPTLSPTFGPVYLVSDPVTDPVTDEYARGELCGGISRNPDWYEPLPRGNIVIRTGH